MAAARAEAARLKREREEKEAAKMEWGKGLVQRDEAKAQRKHLESIKGTDWRRTRDDEELNARQKEKEIWNDPAAAFLTVISRSELRVVSGSRLSETKLSE